jgi:hypothetical protein
MQYIQSCSWITEAEFSEQEAICFWVNIDQFVYVQPLFFCVCVSEFETSAICRQNTVRSESRCALRLRYVHSIHPRTCVVAHITWIPLRIRRILASNLGPSYDDEAFSLFAPIPSAKPRCPPPSRPSHVLPHPFQFTDHSIPSLSRSATNKPTHQRGSSHNHKGLKHNLGPCLILRSVHL